MRFNNNIILELDVTLNTIFKKPNAPLVMGLFLVSLSLVGQGGFGLASMVNGPLQIHHESVTGSLIQLPLSYILEQFQEQLDVEYTAPKEALTQRVSVDLHGESVPEALAKILVRWDYALTIDPAGRVQEIYVVRKIPTGEPEKKAIKTENDRSVAPHSRRSNKRGRAFRGESQGARLDERHGESPTFGTSDPAIQSGPSQQDERELWEAMDETGIGRIPPSDYPEMEVKQVSEEAQKAILQSLNPLPMGSMGGTDYPEMNISPVSEEEAQEILRSLNQSIGSSMEASFP